MTGRPGLGWEEGVLGGRTLLARSQAGGALGSKRCPRPTPQSPRPVHPQYSGASLCGLCVRYRGTGQGLGGNPISSSWQPGFICDECPECRYGDLDLQWSGDGRWRIEWEPVQCPTGGSNFKYGFQGARGLGA